MSYLNQKYNSKAKYTRFHDYMGHPCTVDLNVKLCLDDFNQIVSMVESAYRKGFYEGRANIQYELKEILGLIETEEDL